MSQPTRSHDAQSGPAEPDPRRTAGTRRSGGGRFRPWLVVLTAVVILWLGIFVLPIYITLDPSRSPIGLLEGSQLHYPIVIVHVAGGLLAMLGGCFQVWPWLRQTHPRVHRMVGRIYIGSVFAAAPAALALVVLGALRDGPLFDTYFKAFSVGSTVWAILWLFTAARGLYLIRRRRIAEHRRMMVYSFALTLAILHSRIVVIMASTEAIPGVNFFAFYEVMGWLPWIAHLLVAHWWLNRTAHRPLALPPSVVLAQPAATPARDPA